MAAFILNLIIKYRLNMDLALFIFVVWNKPDSMALMSLHDLIVLLLRG